MECHACGYEHQYEYKEGRRITLHGDEEFIEINGHFTRTVDNDYFNNEKVISLYACPKCYTVIANIW